MEDLFEVALEDALDFAHYNRDISDEGLKAFIDKTCDEYGLGPNMRQSIFVYAQEELL